MIHPTAIISPKAELDTSVQVGPHVIIEEYVRIAAGTTIMANAYLTGHTEIGRDNQVHIGAVLGHTPQDTHFKPGTRSYLRIGDRNIFREYCTVHRGTQPDSATAIGNDCFLMAAAHVGHNCTLGNHVIMANAALLAGHVVVGDRAFVSGGAGAQQFIRIGRVAMIAGLTRLSMDAPPFVIVAERNEVYALNLVGLKRAGITGDALSEIKKLFKLFFRSGINGTDALAQATAGTAEGREFVEFIRTSPNGICHRARD